MGTRTCKWEGILHSRRGPTPGWTTALRTKLSLPILAGRAPIYSQARRRNRTKRSRATKDGGRGVEASGCVQMSHPYDPLDEYRIKFRPIPGCSPSFGPLLYLVVGLSLVVPDALVRWSLDPGVERGIERTANKYRILRSGPRRGSPSLSCLSVELDPSCSGRTHRPPPLLPPPRFAIGSWCHHIHSSLLTLFIRSTR